VVTAPARRSGPRSGDVVFVGQAASVQFAGANAFNFRITRAHDWPTYEGRVWLDGYQLGPEGDAIERRQIFVRTAGLRPAHPPDQHSTG